MLFPDHAEILLGVDPGKDGAIAILSPEGLVFIDMPTLRTGVGEKRDYDVHELASSLTKIRIGSAAQGLGPSLHAFVERQQSMPGQGVATSFQIGLGYGVLLGVLGACQIPFTTVRPNDWKRRMMDGMPKGKESSLAKAKQMFPQAAHMLKRVKDHNRAEAALLAEYGRRELLAIR